MEESNKMDFTGMAAKLHAHLTGIILAAIIALFPSHSGQYSP